MHRHSITEKDVHPDDSHSGAWASSSVLAGNRWLVDTFICHRGFHNDNSSCPENSMRAFEIAAQKGLAIELDVQLLTDGEIAVFHDSSALRMTGVDRLIVNCEAHQIRKMRLLDSDQTVPLLDDVIDLVRGEVPLLIEMKGFGSMGLFEKTIVKKLKGYGGPFALQSFNPRVLLWLKMRSPHIPRGQVSGSLEDVKLAWHRKVLVRNLLTNGFTRPHFISYEAACIPNMKRVRALRTKMPVIGWTVRSLEQYKRVKRYCDNIIFEGFDPSTACI